MITASRTRGGASIGVLSACCALACVLLAGACKREPHKVPSSYGKSRGIGPAIAEQTAADEDPAAAGEEQDDETRAESPATPAPAPAAAAEAATDKDKEPKKRDFGEELKSKLAGAATCMKPRLANTSPARIDVSVTGVVMPTGSVGRSEASCGDLEAAEIACIRRLIESAHFAPPIENAPFSVSAVLTINQVPQAAPATAPAAPPAPTAPQAPAY